MKAPVIVVFAAALIAVSSSGWAAGPEPWNCDGKQEFKHTQPMTYEAKSHSDRDWRLFLMQYEQYTGHNGFTIVIKNDLVKGSDPVRAPLGPGKYYAVAEYRDRNGNWVCPQTNGPADSPAEGAIYDFCFGEGGGQCRVSLTIREEHLKPLTAPP